MPSKPKTPAHRNRMKPLSKTFKKNDVLREKATRQPTPPDTSPITTSKSYTARTSTPPPAAPPKKTTPQPSSLLKNQTHKGLPPSHPAEDQADPPPPHISKRGQATPHQHNVTRPERHNSTHGKVPQNQEFPYRKNPFR